MLMGISVSQCQTSALAVCPTLLALVEHVEWCENVKQMLLCLCFISTVLGLLFSLIE